MITCHKTNSAMKKYIVLLLCLIACRPVVVAQEEIDTIPEFYHHYMYQWVDDSAEVCWHDSMLCVRNWSSLRYTGYYNSIISMPALIRTLAAQYEISDSAKIVGIAAVMDTASLGATPDTLSFELSLYKPVGGNMQLLKSDTISVSDFVRKMKMLFLEGEIHCNQEPSSYDDYVRYYSTYEVYFEEPVVMTDSFCIGFTHFYDWEEYECRYHYYPVRLREEHINCRYGIHRMPLNTIRYKLKSDPPDAPWHQTLGHLVLCLMPIVERPCDTCGVVRDFRQQWIADQTLFVQWDTLPNHTSWQLSYCAAGTDPDHGTIVDCPLPQAVVGNVVGASDMVFHVRARCKDIRWRQWSPWSEAQPVALNAVEAPDGGPDALTVSPNPTTGALHVDCGAAMTAVELYSLRGELLLAQPAHRSAALDLDISSLPQALYLLLVHTDKGTLSRVVAKQ